MRLISQKQVFGRKQQHFRNKIEQKTNDSHNTKAAAMMPQDDQSKPSLVVGAEASNDNEEDKTTQQQPPAPGPTTKPPSFFRRGSTGSSFSHDRSRHSTGGEDDSDGSNTPLEGSEQGLLHADVICARNRISHNHPGNIQYQAIVKEYRDEYQSTSTRMRKNAITRTIIQRVKDYGGRFVKVDKNSNRYEEVGPEAEYEKVSHALRLRTKDQKRMADSLRGSSRGSSRSSVRSARSSPRSSPKSVKADSNLPTSPLGRRHSSWSGFSSTTSAKGMKRSRSTPQSESASAPAPADAVAMPGIKRSRSESASALPVSVMAPVDASVAVPSVAMSLPIAQPAQRKEAPAEQSHQRLPEDTAAADDSEDDSTAHLDSDPTFQRLFRRQQEIFLYLKSQDSDEEEQEEEEKDEEGNDDEEGPQWRNNNDDSTLGTFPCDNLTLTRSLDTDDGLTEDDLHPLELETDVMGSGGSLEDLFAWADRELAEEEEPKN